MATTPVYNLPYPLGSDPVQVHIDIQNLATTVDTVLQGFTISASTDNVWTATNTFSATSSNPAVKITQAGTGNALVVEDVAGGDSTPFVIDASGNVAIGKTTASEKLDIVGNINTTGTVKLNGSTSGSITLTVPATAGTNTITFPALTGTLMTNPMTTAGDLIYGGASGSGTRLAAGTNGYVLTMVSGNPAWAVAPAGYLAPTIGTTSITSGGTFTTLPGVTSVNGTTIPASATLLTSSSPTINTPTLTLSSTPSTTDAVISWDATNKKIQVGDGTSSTDFASSTVKISVPTFTTNAYTAVATDKDKWIELNNGATAGTFYIDVDANLVVPIGTQLQIIQTGAGQITIAATTPATTTINASPGLKLRGQWSSATIVKRGANLWVAVGDLSA